MHGAVVKEGRIYEAPGQKGRGRVGYLRQGEVVTIGDAALDGAWAHVTTSTGLRGFTRSYRLAVGGAHGIRLDLQFGYDGWSHKPDHRQIEEQSLDERYEMVCASDDAIEGELVEPPVEEQHNPMADLAVMLAETVVESDSEPQIPVQAAILNSGNQMELPPTDAPLGRLEPGNNFLAMFDRWMTSKERRKALGTVNDASEARYAFGATLVRWSVLALAGYGALTIALKYIP